MEGSALQVNRQAALLVERDAAKVLCVDGRRNVIWDDCATTARSHERDDYITGKNCVASQLLVFLRRDEASLRPLELIVHRVVDAKNSDAAVGEFRVKQLAAEWAGADRVWRAGRGRQSPARLPSGRKPCKENDG